jgi:hypothetical protein
MQPLAQRTARPTTQAVAKIGHNDGPPLNPFGLHAAWLRFANEIELIRLAKLQARINRRQRAINDLIAERQKIMNRCIRRMRRKSGKN